MDLTTSYMGIPLKNPIIVGSSGLTNSVDKIKKIDQSGAGAVVLKSIFEEEIVFEHEDILKEAESADINTDQFDYYDYHLKGKKLNQFIDLIKASKSEVSIPVIASINCVYSHEWGRFCPQTPGCRSGRHRIEHVFSAVGLEPFGPGPGKHVLQRHRKGPENGFHSGGAQNQPLFFKPGPDDSETLPFGRFRPRAVQPLLQPGLRY